MRKICACHEMRCCHGIGLNPKIDNQNVSLISTVPMLVNLYGGKLKGILSKFPFLICVLEGRYS